MVRQEISSRELTTITLFRRDFLDKTEALRFKLQLKRIKNKEYIRKTYSGYFLNS